MGRSLGGAYHDEVLLHKKSDREEGQNVTLIQAEQKKVAWVDDEPEETQLGRRSLMRAGTDSADALLLPVCLASPILSPCKLKLACGERKMNDLLCKESADGTLDPSASYSPVVGLDRMKKSVLFRWNLSILNV